MAYQTIPAETFDAVFTAKGFTKVSHGHEIVYEREHHSVKGLKVRVFSSLPVGGAAARGVGQDAIRVTLAYYRGDKSWGLAKAKRVNRTGSPIEVLDRAVERARGMYALANEYAKRGPCGRCGGARWASGQCIAESMPRGKK